MIVKTITDDYYFWNWLKKSDDYQNKFSLEGAIALQAFYEKLSESINENIEFDPIVWCCAFSEFKNLTDCWEEKSGSTKTIEGEPATTKNIRAWLEYNTNIIDLSNGRMIVGEF